MLTFIFTKTAIMQNLNSSTKDPFVFLVTSIDSGRFETVFTPENFDQTRNEYVFPTLGFRFSKEFVDDVLKNTAHYRGFLPKTTHQ